MRKELCEVLKADVSEDEIKQSMFEIKEDKALDPNGYIAEFFKQN